MKKRILCILLTVLSVCLSFTFASCSAEPDEGTYTRVTVDMNPSIELMVDDQNKIAAVTALNDDGAILIAGEALVGKTPEEATEIIITLAAETGYLVEGNAQTQTNTVKISVSGDGAYSYNLEKDIKESIEDVMDDLDINGKVEKAQALKTDALRALAAESTLFTEEEIAQMNEAQLYKAIAAARIETAELLTNEMRQAYLRAKEYEFSFAKSKATAAVIEQMGGLYQLTFATYKTALNLYSNSINAIDQFRYDNLVSPESDYQKALTALRASKAKFLKQRSYVATLNVNGTEYASASVTLAATEQQYNTLLASFEALGNTLNASLEALITAMRSCETTLRSIEASFSDDIKTELAAKATEIDAQLNTAKTNFFNKFETAHKSDIEALEATLIAQKNALKDQATGKAA